jgi:hypothetical protein
MILPTLKIKKSWRDKLKFFQEMLKIAKKCLKNMANSGKFWRDDGRCGKDFPLSNGEPGQCDPEAKNWGACCSPGGWYGNTDDHCKCPSCVSYAGN